MKTKVELCYNFTLVHPNEIIINDPIYKLLNKYEEIKLISKNKKDKLNQFLFFNNNTIHTIMYEIEEVYRVPENINFSELFYLSLAILQNPETIDYTYSLNYIKLIYDKLNNNEDLKPIKKILLAKIILILIYNYKGEDEYNEEEDGEDLKLMENQSKVIIDKNLEIFKKLNIECEINEIYECKIDNLYKEIILSLIKENKFNDYIFCKSIIDQLDLENINITKTIYEGLYEYFNSNNLFLDIYNIRDLNDVKNINFYYILIKYIFKNSLYIYNIDFLFKNIKKIFKLIKEQQVQSEKKSEFNEYGLNDKIIEILEFFSYKYSDIFKSTQNKIYNKNPPYSLSIHNYCDDERKEIDNGREISKEEKDTNNSINNKIEYEKAVEILQYLKFKIKIEPCENNNDNEDSENKFKFIEIEYGKKGENKLLKDEEELKIHEDYDIITNEDKKHENAEIVYKNYKKLAYFLNEIQEYIKYSGIQFNPQIEIELINEEREIYDEEDGHHDYKDLYYITCNSTFINQINNNEELSFKDENILVHSINGKSQGFINLINELNNEDYIDAKFVY